MVASGGMGRLRVQLAVSADGFIAPLDRSFAWLEPFPASEFGFDRFFASIGSLLMGRSTFDELRKTGPSPFDALPTLVLTSRPLAAGPNVEPVSLERLRAGVGGLRQGPKDIWLFGGGKTIAACLEQRLVDTLELAVIPRLLGNGLPLFPPRTPALEALRLVEAKKMKKDVLWLEYAVGANTRPVSSAS
jgi:dihydrofolate reductase